MADLHESYVAYFGDGITMLSLERPYPKMVHGTRLFGVDECVIHNDIAMQFTEVHLRGLLCVGYPQQLLMLALCDAKARTGEQYALWESLERAQRSGLEQLEIAVPPHVHENFERFLHVASAHSMLAHDLSRY